MDILPARSLGMQTLIIRSRDDLLAISRNLIERGLKQEYAIPEEVLKEKFEGALIGIYVGDALGMPFEQMSHEQIQAHYGTVTQMLIGDKRHITETKPPITLPKGQGTDDTLLMIAIAESILEYSGVVEQDSLINKFANYYDPRIGFSSRTARLLRAVEKGISWRKLVDQEENRLPSNGAAMRTAPIVLRCYNDFNLLEEQLLASAEITHRHPLAIVGSLIQGFALAEAFNVELGTTFDPINFIDNLIGHAHRFEEKYLQDQDTLFKNIFTQKLKIVKRLLEQKDVSPAEAIQALGNDSTAYESIPIAIYSFLRHPYSFRDAISYAVNLGDDTDTIGAMTGALSGAFLGISAIPKGWIEDLHPLSIQDSEKGKEYVSTLAERLLQLHKNIRKSSDEDDGTSVNDKGTSSPIGTNNLGGIDLRALPIVSQPLNTQRPNIPLNRLDNFRADPEWQEIKNMVNVGIIPSGQRIKDYLQSCCQKKENGEIGAVLNCIADILRIEEERVSPTDPDLKDMLVLLESGKSGDELKSALN